MNFLAHYLLATEHLPSPTPLSSYTVGVTLPDLLPLASARMRQASLALAPQTAAQDRALLAGVLTHLETDTAFHKTAAFAEAQTVIGDLILYAGFTGIRVRRFFLAHILTELVLDAVLLRRDSSLPYRFYAAFIPAELHAAYQWTEATLGRSVPHLPAVLTRFAQSQYLFSYTADAGVAEGIVHLCRQARQDRFVGANEARLVRLVTAAVQAITPSVERLLSETAHAVRASHPFTTEK